MRFENKILLRDGYISKTYLSYDRKLSKTVIIKEFSKENREVARREYEFLLRIKYKLPQVYDLIEDENVSCIVREYIPGKTLKELIEERGEIPPPIALFICYEVLRFLDFVHAMGEFNGDITPSNIIIGFDGVVRILDCAKSEELITPEYYDPSVKKDIIADLVALAKVLEKMTRNRTLLELSRKAQIGKYKEPSEFISDVIRIMPEFQIALEKDLKAFIVDNYRSDVSNAKKSARFKRTFLSNVLMVIFPFVLGALFVTALSKIGEDLYENTNTSTVRLPVGEQRTSSGSEVWQMHNTSGQGATQPAPEVGTELGKNKPTPFQSRVKALDHQKNSKKSNFSSKSANKHVTSGSDGNDGYGYLFINSIPDCEIWLDGRYIDRVPILNFKVSAGTRTIEFRSGRKTYKTKVEVRKNERLYLFADVLKDKLEIRRE